jgi:ketosteroid isomerase-like protein
MTRIRLLVLYLPLFAIAQQSTESADKSMILALESAWNQAEIHHDTNAAAALMADTFISVDHHGALLNKAQYLAGIKDPSFHPQEISNRETSVYIYGDTAIVSSAYRTKVPTAASPSNTTAALPIPGLEEMESGCASPITKP